MMSKCGKGSRSKLSEILKILKYLKVCKFRIGKKTNTKIGQDAMVKIPSLRRLKKKFSNSNFYCLLEGSVKLSLDQRFVKSLRQFTSHLSSGEIPEIDAWTGKARKSYLLKRN